VRPLTEEEIAGRLRGLEPIQALAVAFRCVLRSLPCMAAGAGILRSLSSDDVSGLDQTLRSASRLILESIDPRLADLTGAANRIPGLGGMQRLLGLVPANSPGAAILQAVVELNAALSAPTHDAAVEMRVGAAMRSASLALFFLEPPAGGQGPELMKGFLAGMDEDIASVVRSQKSSLPSLGVMSLFVGSPLWPSGVPETMAKLFVDWESMLRGLFQGVIHAGWTVESTIALVKALWDGEMPFDAMFDPGIRERLGQITQRKNALPQVLALAPRELASRLAVLASRDTKLLPVLASPTKATLEGVVKSHGAALLEGVRPELGDVADPLWLAWYSGALGRVMGGMQATSPVVPPAEPAEAKAKSEPRPTPVVKRAPAKAGVGSRPAAPSRSAPSGDALKRADTGPFKVTVEPSKPSRPISKKK
jgi:hypothetical protein